MTTSTSKMPVIINCSVPVYQYTYTVPKPRREEPEMIERILDAVADVFEVAKFDMLGHKTRKREWCLPRQMVWKVIHELDPDYQLKRMADLWGGFDHTTVIHGINSVTDAMLTDQRLVCKYEGIKQELKDYYDKPLQHVPADRL